MRYYRTAAPLKRNSDANMPTVPNLMPDLDQFLSALFLWALVLYLAP
jgi:hypothetical protein